MIIGVLIHSVFLHFVRDLKAATDKIVILSNSGSYAFKLSHNITEATKNISCEKSEGAIDQSTITKWFKKFCLSYKNLNDQVRSGRLKNSGFQGYAPLK